jgi:adenosylcobinamide kinase / adenosylcobinamide-phosphate guanylyltransferase
MTALGRVLITGGARSGKSARAVQMASEYPAGRRFFIATGEARDEEMRLRIERHRRDRGDVFETVEEPIEIARALDAIGSRARVVVIDCLTLWVANLMERGVSDETMLGRAAELAQAIERCDFDTIVVTDEVGAGVVPEHPTARRFRDLLGWTNQTIARMCGTVILMVAGQPLTLKGAPVRGP